jgi:multiple sugar transport system substrate-binding protein
MTFAEPTRLTLWRHQTGDDEMNASIAAIERFNRSQSSWHVTMQSLPQGSYTQSITAAALARQLPCIIDIDQPVVPNFAWSGHLRPLDDLLSDEVLNRILPVARGTYLGKIYSVGQFDISLALFARRSELETLGVRVATREQPYSAAEFLDVLRRIKRERPDSFPFDVNRHMTGEWIAYGLSPWLQSGGADLINRSDYLTAEGVLNGPRAVDVMRWYRTLFVDQLIDKDSVDDQSLIQGRSVFHYTGSWVARPYQRLIGDDLVIMPPIDFGEGPRVGSGSWQWGITRSCEHPQGAALFIDFLMRDDEIAEISRATGFVPVSEGAAAQTERYRLGGPWRAFFEYLKHFAVARPATPAYPKISASFEKAALDIGDGKDIQDALDVAVDAIENDIYRNRGYGFETR